MVATVQILRLTGAGPTTTNITDANTRSSLSDDPAPGSNNPLIIPGAGTIYSYWVTTRLNVTVTPDGTIDNLRWYSDGTGADCNGQEATSYVQATGTLGEAGDQLTTGNHAGITGSPVSVFGHTVGTPKALAGSLNNPDTGQFGSRFVYQFFVTSAASPGVRAAETFTWRYDET